METTEKGGPSDEAWHLVKNTPRVTGLWVRTESDAAERRRSSADRLSRFDAADKPKPKLTFEKGETVKIIDGPFRKLSRRRR
jgi:transcriptional antiterminator NusG